MNKIFSQKSSLAFAPKKSNTSKKINFGWGLMMLLAVFLFLLAGRYLSLDPDVYFQREVYLTHTGFLIMHIAGAMLAIVIGPFQFLQSIRTRFLKLHRWLGRIYLLSVLFSGVGGLYMSFLAYGGIVSQLGFMVLAIAWLFSGYMAYRFIRKKEIKLHRKWMTINYALTFAGVTLRLWLPIFSIIGLDFLTSYIIVAWWCWVPNLFVALWMNMRNANNEVYESVH